MPKPRQLKQTRILIAAVLGRRAQPTRRFDRVLAALQRGQSAIVELRWSPGGRMHQLTLHRVDGDRITFTNAARIPGLAPGTPIQAPLARRVEPGGLESATIADLRALFEEGKGEALVI